VTADPPSTAESPDVIAIRSLIDRIVAENGALLNDPTSKQETLLGQSPPREIRCHSGTQKRGPHRGRTRDCRHCRKPKESPRYYPAARPRTADHLQQGLPDDAASGVNKASGLTAALDKLHLSFRNTVGVGDAENDHAFLSVCEVSVAVANALQL
jgi:hypothetical protein